MARQTVGSVTIDKNVRPERVYPTAETRLTDLSRMKTVGIRLSKTQAIHLARVLLAASQDWDELEITAYRLRPRKSDSTYQVMVTTAG